MGVVFSPELGMIPRSHAQDNVNAHKWASIVITLAMFYSDSKGRTTLRTWALLHPLLDRVLSIRENARLKGFPDCYKFPGPIKERYVQVGNAIAVPIAGALGYSLGMALKGLSGENLYCHCHIIFLVSTNWSPIWNL
ncbi:DNA (cytosine-5)-methyltransferase CMT3 [Capsicum chinense]|nr:DNA (cytosine-5)-methyltransferase CMT3 [Capsicum chinense]